MINYRVRVKNIIRKYGTADPLEVAKAMDVIVFAADLPDSVNGVWKKMLGVRLIAYNEDLTEDWQIKAVVGHELGHILLHPSYRHFCTEGRTYYASTKHEEEADNMAVALCVASIDIEEDYIRDFLRSGWRQKNKASKY